MELIEQIGRVWNEKEFTLLDEILSEAFVGHLMDDGRDLDGREAYREWVEETYEMFPDLELRFDPVFTREDILCGRWTFTGTHDGPIPAFGIEPTGRTVEFSGLFIDQLEDGRIVEMWHQMDKLTLMGQLGMLEGEESAATA